MEDGGWRQGKEDRGLRTKEDFGARHPGGRVGLSRSKVFGAS